MTTEGFEVRSVGNTLVLHETALIEAFNLKAAIEYQLKNCKSQKHFRFQVYQLLLVFILAFVHSFANWHKTYTFFYGCNVNWHFNSVLAAKLPHEQLWLTLIDVTKVHTPVWCGGVHCPSQYIVYSFSVSTEGAGEWYSASSVGQKHLVRNVNINTNRYKRTVIQHSQVHPYWVLLCWGD